MNEDRLLLFCIYVSLAVLTAAAAVFIWMSLHLIFRSPLFC